MEKQADISQPAKEESFTESLENFDFAAFFSSSNVKKNRTAQAVTGQKAYEESLSKGFSNGYALNTRNNAIDRDIRERLTSSGVDTTSGSYPAIHSAMYELSPAVISDDDWDKDYTDPTTGETRPFGDYMTDLVTNRLIESQTSPSPFSEEKQEVLDNMHTELDGLRDNLATLSAKRQGRVFGKGGEAYQEALSAYNTHLVALGELENEHILTDESKTEDEKKVKVVEYLLNEQTELRALTTEKLKNTKVGKVVEWLTSGTRSQRILKGIAVGAGAAVVAGAVAAGAGVLGVAGAAAVGVGAGVALRTGVRFARGFAAADSKAGRGMAKEADGVGVLEALQTPVDGEEPNYVQRISDLFGHQLEEDTQKEQLKRRKSVAKGLGAVALGAVVGTAGGILIGELASHGTDFNPFSGHIGNHAGATDHGTEHGGAGQQSPDAQDDHRAWLEQQQAQQAAQEAAEKAAEQAANTPDPNFYVNPGEGGIQLFNHMGLSEGQWYQVQEDLLHKFPSDFYQNPGQAVRLSHSGQLSIEAQKYIKSAFGMH